MSKKIENPALQALIYFVAILIASLIIWPLLDLLICGVFTHSEFHYAISDYIVEPLIFSVIFTLLFYVPPIVKAHKKKK